LTKALLIALTSAAYLVLYFSFTPLLGWPSGTDLPKRFSLLAIYGQEPDRITGAKGNIFFWVQDKTSGNMMPRAYVVDYDPELHARAKEARQRLHKNVPQVGEAGDALLDPNMRMGTGKEEHKAAKAHKFTVKFFDAPSDAPPTKGELPPPVSDAPAAESTATPQG
jgi:hypothetical protein